MFRTARASFFALVFFFAIGAHAQSPALPTLSQSDFNNVIRELAANSLFNSVTPASSLGALFGVEVGLTGGVTNTPEINRLVNTQIPNTKADYFPHASLLAAVTFPIAVTAEVLYVPQVSSQSVKYDAVGAALKWTPTDGLLVWPLNMSVRGFLTKTKVSFNQIINNASTANQDVNTTVTYDGEVKGLQLLVSPKVIPVLEPYAGIGQYYASGKMDVSGTAQLFNFSSAQSASSSPTTTAYLLGLDVRLLVLAFGVQYERAFDTSVYTGRLSLRF
ncbi:MAG: DUF6588 family protein [Bdellovibrionota bacterium]